MDGRDDTDAAGAVPRLRVTTSFHKPSASTCGWASSLERLSSSISRGGRYCSSLNGRQSEQIHSLLILIDRGAERLFWHQGATYCGHVQSFDRPLSEVRVVEDQGSATADGCKERTLLLDQHGAWQQGVRGRIRCCHHDPKRHEPFGTLRLQHPVQCAIT